MSGTAGIDRYYFLPVVCGHSLGPSSGCRVNAGQLNRDSNISSSLQYLRVPLISAPPLLECNAILWIQYWPGGNRCGVSCFHLAFSTVITRMLQDKEVMWGLVQLPGMSVATTHLGMREMTTSESIDPEDSPWVGSFRESICPHSNKGAFRSQGINWPMTLYTTVIQMSGMARVTLSLARHLNYVSSMASPAPLIPNPL